MKLWIDDLRPAPDGYIWIKSVDAAIICLSTNIGGDKVLNIDEINLDHDAGDYANMGGDYINILDWIEMRNIVDNVVINSTFKFHSMNPIGVENMKRICIKNGWKVVV